MKVIVRNARMSFNDIFEPNTAIKGGKPKFSITAICSDDTTVKYDNSKGETITKSHDALANICQHVAKEKWGKVPPKLANWAYNKADGSTTRDEYVNDDGDFWAGFDENTWYVSAGKLEKLAKNGKMTVLDQHRKPIAANSGLLFSGCYINLIIDVYAYDNETGKGVTASLEGVQLLRKGEPLGISNIDAENEFDDEEMPPDQEIDTDDSDAGDASDLL